MTGVSSDLFDLSGLQLENMAMNASESLVTVPDTFLDSCFNVTASVAQCFGDYKMNSYIRWHDVSRFMGLLLGMLVCTVSLA